MDTTPQRPTSQTPTLWQKINIFKGFYKKPLYLHGLWILFLLTLLITIFYYSIDFFTHHGRYAKTPAVTGLHYNEAFNDIQQQNLEPVIGDSMFLLQYAPGTVIKQIPEAGADVKKNRKIYLVINKTRPPMMDIPKVIGLNIGVASGILKSSGLSIEDTIYQNDLSKNIILNLSYNGSLLKEHEQIPMGSKIAVILGNGSGYGGDKNALQSDNKIWTPDFIGQTVAQVKEHIQKYPLQLLIQNEQEYSDYSEHFLYVTKQEPFRYNTDHQVTRIATGSIITVWVSPENPLQ